MSLINLTPHAVQVINEDGHGVIFPTTGVDVRLIEKSGEPLIRKHEDPPFSIISPPIYTGLTLSKPGAYPKGPWIVSMLVGKYVSEHGPPPEATAIYSPDTGPEGVVRNAAGQIIGTRNLVRWY